MRRVSFLALVILIAGCSRPPEPNIRTVPADAFTKPDPVESIPASVVRAKAEEPTSEVLRLPERGVWPWPVGAGRPLSGLVPLPQHSPGQHELNGAAISRASGKAVVFWWITDFKNKSRMTRIAWCDLAAGQVLAQWDLANCLLEPFALSPDGRQFLTRASSRIARDAQVVELWTINAQGKLQRSEWLPYWTGQRSSGERPGNTMPKVTQPKAEVRWAGFAGGRIVTVCGDGELKVWEVVGEKFKQRAVLNGVLGLPAVSPDDHYVALVVGESVALLDPAAGKIIGDRRIGKPPAKPVVAWHDSGAKLAVAGPGRISVLDIAANRTWDAYVAELKLDYRGLRPNFGWAGDASIYDNGQLFDLQSPIVVWRYNSFTQWAAPCGSTTWAIAQALGESETALRSFQLPHPPAESALLAARRRSDLYALRPGDGVRVDVAGLPKEKQKEVRTTLERRLRELGYRLDPQAPTVFIASADSTGPTITQTYSFGSNRKVTGSYVRRYARLKAVRNGQVLWQRELSHEPGLLITVPGNVDPKSYISSYGKPNYTLFTKQSLPGVIRAGSAEPLGTSTLAAGGVR